MSNLLRVSSILYFFLCTSIPSAFAENIESKVTKTFDVTVPVSESKLSCVFSWDDYSNPVAWISLKWNAEKYVTIKDGWRDILNWSGIDYCPSFDTFAAQGNIQRKLKRTIVVGTREKWKKGEQICIRFQEESIELPLYENDDVHILKASNSLIVEELALSTCYEAEKRSGNRQ